MARYYCVRLLLPFGVCFFNLLLATAVFVNYLRAAGFSALLGDLPKEKAKWITMDNNKLVFNILEPVITQYGMTRTCHKLDPSFASDDIYDAVSDAAFFHHLFNGMSAPNSDLESKIQIEFTRLESSKGDCDGPFDTPIMPNLYCDGVVDHIVIEKENNVSDYYGLRVTNNVEYHNATSYSPFTPRRAKLRTFLAIDAP